MPDFARRATQAELMDDLTLASDELRRNLDELGFINTWLGGYRVVTDALQRLRPRFPGGRPLQIADLGSGGGDTLRHVAGWARRKGIGAELTGIDANAFMVDYARQRSRQFPEISYQQQNVFAPDFARQPFDVISCSLFCHHFTDEQLATLLHQLSRQARVAVVINDLHRHPLAYYSIKWLTRLFRGSYLVQNDAPLSVLRAFDRPDWVRIMGQAGIRECELRWRWAFRWQVIITGTAGPA